MSPIEFSSDVDVTLIDSMGNDASLAHAAWVSTKGAAAEDADESRVGGLLEFLVRESHGSPFEAAAMTFLVTAPLFVWREHHRHRIGLSYSEESGRYRQLAPRFYIPAAARTQTGKPGAYLMTEESGLTSAVRETLRETSTIAYRRYENLLKLGVAREMARMVLPVNIYSSCYVTCNPRSLMHFLTLRDAPTAQHEIRLVARKYAAEFEKLFPLTYAAYLRHRKDPA